MDSLLTFSKISESEVEVERLLDIVMPITGNKNDTVRYTAVLPVEHVNELKKLVREARIPSVNKGIRLAIEDFVKAQNKLIYEQKMRKAAEDKDYINRIAETEADFALVDDEEMSSW